MAEVKQDNRVVRYFKETRAELKKTHWPSRQEARNLTIIVLVVTVTMTILLFSMDRVWEWLFLGILVAPRDTLRIIISVVLSVIGLVALVVAARRQ